MRWLRVLGGAAILAVVGWRVGPAPFADAVRAAGPAALAAALAITAVTTVCCAWRWRLLAGGLGACGVGDRVLPLAVPQRDAPGRGGR